MVSQVAFQEIVAISSSEELLDRFCAFYFEGFLREQHQTWVLQRFPWNFVDGGGDTRWLSLREEIS
jgi:hypothetical protein